MVKRKKEDAFTSFRIIGEKAHALLARAKAMKAREGLQHSALPKVKPPSPETVHVVVRLSVMSVIQTTFTILAIALGVLLVYLLQDKIVLMLLGVFVAAIIDPGVKAMKRAGIPRGLGILIHYAIALFLVVFLIVSLIPIIAEQLQGIAVGLNTTVNQFILNPRITLPFIGENANGQLTLFLKSTLEGLSIEEFTDVLHQFGQSLSSAAQGSIQFAAVLAGSVLNFFLNLIVVLVLAFFIQLEKEKIISWIRGFLPWSFRSYVDDKSEAIHWKITQWARGQLMLCVAIGTLVFLALIILRMPYALTLAILAGFTEFIPFVGPFFAAIPAVLIAISQQGFFWGVVIAAVYYVIQWCENNLIVPLIMNRAVGLSPVTIMFALMVGVSFPSVIHPILGIILSIPMATIIVLFLEDWRHARRQKLGASTSV